jgi:hypothetical protein
MSPIPITRELVDELTSQEAELAERLTRHLERAADLRVQRRQVQRARRLALRRLP